jgi:hypothetical protein
MPRSFQIPRALLENATVVDDERHQEPVIARDIVLGSYLTAACGVSNDPPDEGAIVDLTVCNITKYRCSPLTSFIPTVVDILISYDYQITSNTDADFGRVLPFVDESILESLAVAMNLKRCPITNRRKLRRSLQDEFATTELGRFVGVSMLPRDFRDDRFDSCLPEADGTEFTDSVCQPIRGGMTLSLALAEEGQGMLAEEDEETIRLAVLAFIARNMVGDSFVVPGNIDRLTYVGARQVVAGGGLEAAEQNIKDDDDDGGLSSAGKSLLSIVLPLAFIILLLGLVFRKRRRKDGGGDYDYSNRPAELMPGIVALPEEDEQYWHSRRATAMGKQKLSPGSLAFTDSLALEPQFVTEDKMSGVEVRSSSPASFSNSPAKSPRSPSRSIVEEGEELRTEDFTNYHINMSTEEGSQDSLFDIDEEGEDCSEDTSEYTPRGALQMT